MPTRFARSVASAMATLTLALGAIVSAAMLGPHLGQADVPQGDRPRQAPTSARSARAPAPLRGLELAQRREEDGVFVVDHEGSTAILTLDAALQQHIEAFLARNQVPESGVVALEPRSGRVLAYVNHRGRPEAPVDMAREAVAPAASVFKVITGAALIDAGVPATERVCFHGGDSGFGLRHLTPDPASDRTCATLSEAMGGSLNVVFGRLADQHLTPAVLERYGAAFGFGQQLPFDLGSSVSSLEVPADRLEFARTAAGFWHSRLSPLHGALLAATIANDGAMPRAGIVERVIDRTGHVVHRFRPGTHRQVIGAETAHVVNQMMQATVASGTSRRAFHDDRGRPFLPGVEVAAKTGSLSAERPYRGYTWWVGFAPAEDPEIALAVLVVNTPEWRVKASHVAADSLRFWDGQRRAR